MPAGAWFAKIVCGISIPLVAFSQTDPDQIIAREMAERALSRATSQPLGLPKLQHPKANPPTVDRIILGRKLFFDRRLSFNQTMSCAMCHVPEQGFANNELLVSVGMNGASGRRNAPTILNVAYYTRLFVDGRERALETQFFSPLLAHNEMGNPSVGAVVDKVEGLTEYRELFQRAYGAQAQITIDGIGRALAVYQRTLLAADSRFDRWLYGNQPTALSAGEKRGYGLFTGKAGCHQCHQTDATQSLFTDQDFHDIGHGWWQEQKRQRPAATELVQVAPGIFQKVDREIIDRVSDPVPADLGRYEASQKPKDLWKFRTPSLRNVALTSPYMHDGALLSLADVIEHYNGGGRPHASQSPRLKPLNLTTAEKQDLIAFLGSLTSSGIAALIQEARVAEPDN